MILYLAVRPSDRIHPDTIQILRCKGDTFHCIHCDNNSRMRMANVWTQGGIFNFYRALLIRWMDEIHWRRPQLNVFHLMGVLRFMSDLIVVCTRSCDMEGIMNYPYNFQHQIAHLIEEFNVNVSASQRNSIIASLYHLVEHYPLSL